MIKKVLFGSALVLGMGLQGQSYYYIAHVREGNPGGLNAESDQANDQNGGGWTKVTGTQANVVYTGNIAIPFSFKFAGNTVTHLKAATSGFITFDTGTKVAPVTGPAALPTATLPEKAVSIWGMSASGSNDGIFTKTFGAAGKRQFWIKFYSMSTPGDASNSWTYASVVLEEGSNKIYIVMQNCLQGSNAYVSPKHTFGIQVDGTTAVMVAGSPNITNQSSDLIVEDNDYYEFIYGVQPALDLAGMKVDLPAYVSRKAPIDIKLTVRNQGTAAITSYTLNYSVNGGAPVSANVSSANIAPNAVPVLTNSIKWNPPAAGWYTIKAWASNLNNTGDDAPANDTASARTYAYDSAATRKLMHEVFTSSTCPPCNPGNAALQAIWDARPGTHSILKYQCEFPGSGDPYFTTEIGTRRGSYGINSIPSTVRDGLPGVNPNGGYTIDDYDALQAKPSFARIKINSAQLSWKGKVDFEVELLPLEDYMTGNNWRLMAVIAEKTTFKNVETNGETEFTHVAKKMVPGTNGTVLSNLVKGTPQKFNLSYTFPDVYRLPNNATDRINLATETTVEDFWDLEVVVFLQNNTTKEVVQSESKDIAFNTGLNDDELSGLMVYPNPARDEVNISLPAAGNAQLSVFDMNGKLMMQQGVQQSARINTQGWTPGLYMIQVQDGAKMSSRKVMVQR